MNLEQETTAKYFIDKKWLAFQTKDLNYSNIISLKKTRAFHNRPPFWSSIEISDLKLKSMKLLKTNFYDENKKKVFQIIFAEQHVNDAIDLDVETENIPPAEPSDSYLNLKKKFSFCLVEVKQDLNMTSKDFPLSNFMARLTKIQNILNLHFEVLLQSLMIRQERIKNILVDEYSYPSDVISLKLLDKSEDLKMNLEFSAIALKSEKNSIDNLIAKAKKVVYRNCPREINYFSVDSLNIEISNRFTIIEINESDCGCASNRVFKLLNNLNC